MIKIENISFSYRSRASSAHTVLDIPHWSVAAGEQVFLHGPSGSGKSTLLNLLTGILKPNAGNIDILGNRLNNMSSRQRDKWRARHVGVVFQQFNLIPHLDALNNIKLAAWLAGSDNHLAPQRAEDLLLALGISHELHHQPAATLSIGQQQRVAIARALINRPELLIVDEPTSSLDRANRDGFMSLQLDQVQTLGSTLIFVSHDIALADNFSRVEALDVINQVENSQTGGQH